MTTYYKILGPGRMPCWGGSGQWPEPGHWREESGPLALRQRGTLHLLRRADVPDWLKVPAEVWEAEADGEIAIGTGLVGVLRARLTRSLGMITPAALARWASECADHVAHLRGDGGREDAASYAARAAAARAAAYAAARDDYDDYAADDLDAALVAAAVAAYAAARDDYAARAAAYDAERRWQGERLLELLTA